MRRVLDTARLRLRELAETDLDFVADMLADAEVMRYYPKRLTRELSSEWISRQLERYEIDGYGLWLAVAKDTTAPVGQIGLTRQTVDGVDECEVGYLIHRPFWKQGFATEGGLACRDYAFGTLGRSRVIALVRPDNLASQGVAKSLGMEVVGQASHGGYTHLLFAVSKPEAR